MKSTDLADRFLETERNNHRVSIMEWERCEEERDRLRESIVKIHSREWASGDIKAGAKHASEMWAIADKALHKIVENNS